jgi:hypothetical protein
VPPNIVSYVKLHLYPPHGSASNSNDPYLITPDFCRYFYGRGYARKWKTGRLSSRHYEQAGITVQDHQVRQALSQLADDGYLKRVKIPPKDSEGHPLVLCFPSPRQHPAVKVPSSVNKHVFKDRRSIGPRTFDPAELYVGLISWDGKRWVFNLGASWWLSFFRSAHPPKKKTINRLKERIPVLVPDWDGTGYKILHKQDPYVEFGTKHDLRMDPQDDGYTAQQILEIWRNLNRTQDAHTCPTCGGEISYKNTRSKWAKRAAKAHQHVCDMRVVGEVMEEDTGSEDCC